MDPVEEIDLFVEGMHCASCAYTIEKHLKKMDGVLEATVFFASGRAIVHVLQGRVSEQQLIEAVVKAGYRALPIQEGVFRERSLSKGLVVRAVFAFACGIPFLLSMFSFPFPGLYQLLVATCVQIFSAWPFYRGAWEGIRSFSANMDTLVALGTVAAYLYSAAVLLAHEGRALYFETSVLLVAFILLGRILENLAKAKTGQQVSSLLAMQSDIVSIRREGRYEEVPIAMAQEGDLFLTRPGERIALDGVVMEGASYVNESMLTGESLPVYKTAQEKIYAGTLNIEGVLEAKVLKTGKNTALGQIIHLVEKAQLSKPPIQKLVDQVTRYFVPAVLSIALLTWLLWWFFAQDGNQGLIQAVSVLVIACPCAMGLATPTVVLVSLGRAAKEGIVIRNPSILEKALSIDALFVDKTGTLTEGALTVSNITAEKASQTTILHIAGALAQYSNHPIAKAIRTYALYHGTKEQTVERFIDVLGKGLEAIIDGKRYYLGSLSWIEEKLGHVSHKVSHPLEKRVFLADEKEVLGSLSLAERFRSESKEVIEDLHARDIRVVLLSGDKKENVERFTEGLSLDTVYSEVLPQEKAELVNSWKEKGSIVAMVGDGINDAPALAAADVSFAMGSGSDIALESASILLLHSDLRGVTKALHLARKTLWKIRQNLFFAFVYNALGIPFAALGFLHPLFGGIAMALSSICVVVNALFLSRVRL